MTATGDRAAGVVGLTIQQASRVRARLTLRRRNEGAPGAPAAIGGGRGTPAASSATLLLTIPVLSLILLLPLAALIARGLAIGPKEFVQAATAPTAVAACRLSFLAAVAATLLNTVFGTAVAWVLVRHRFPLRGAAGALVDLPLALPTAVAGLTLSHIYGPAHPLGAALARAGFPVAYAPPGIILAMTFVSLPFVIRSVQPVLLDLEPEIEEAARSLGADSLRTFRHVLLPSVLPAVVSGAALSFARALGEYGSVVLISGNLPGRSLVAPTLIVQQIEEHRTEEAVAVALVLLTLAFATLALFHIVQRWGRRHDA